MRFLLTIACTFMSNYLVEVDLQDKFNIWETEIVEIEKRLKDKPLATGGTVFAGSSTIRLWKVGEAFPKQPVANVGFGGSTLPDVTHFAPRLILPLAPGTIVLYAGDNDIAKGAKPEKVRDDFTAFVNLVHKQLPKTRILFLSIKPSPKRWNLYGKQTEANTLIKDLCSKDDRLVYVDIVPLMLNQEGKPITKYFVKDELHLSAKGYEVWTAAVTKALEKK